MHGEKARWELHKNTECCLEQIQEATLYKTTAVRSHAPISQNIQVR